MMGEVLDQLMSGMESYVRLLEEVELAARRVVGGGPAASWGELKQAVDRAEAWRKVNIGALGR